MSQRKIKKLRKEYRIAMKAKAEEDTQQLQIFLTNKSFSYRFNLAMKILFKIKEKRNDTTKSKFNSK